jgi:hypothetical protein
MTMAQINQAKAQCEAVGQSCASTCQPSGGGGTNVTMPNFNTGDSGDSSMPNGADPNANAGLNFEASEQQKEQLSNSWAQNDQRRLAAAEQFAKNEMTKTFSAICSKGTIGPHTCQQIAALIAQLPQSSAATAGGFLDRFKISWGSRGPSPLGPNRIGGGLTNTFGNLSTPSDKGCYVTADFVATGEMWAVPLPDPNLRMRLLDDHTGYVLYNDGTHDTYVGYPVPYDMLLPAGGTLIVGKGNYVSKNDPHAFTMEIGIKYWSNGPDCANNAVQAGYTTPEEWGPDYTGPDPGPDPALGNLTTAPADNDGDDDDSDSITMSQSGTSKTAPAPDDDDDGDIE